MAGGASNGPSANPSNKFVLFLRESLLLLAIQVVTVTYEAALNPPGGVWPESKDGHLTGNPILALTDHVRYNAFSCSNATALMVSAAVVLLLLFVRGKSSERHWFNTVLRTVMSLGTLAFAVPYAAGASRHKFTTNFASVLIALLFVCVVIFTVVWICPTKKGFSGDLPAFYSRSMLSAIFVASMAYTAGLSPPGGFWLDTQEGHQAGDPALVFHNRRRFTAFFVGNTMAFVASLCIIPLVLTNNIKQGFMGCWHYLCNNIAQNGLVIAYAAGSSMEKSYIAYVLLSGTVIFPVLAFMLVIQWYIWPAIWKPLSPVFVSNTQLIKPFTANRAICGCQTSSSNNGTDATSKEKEEEEKGIDAFFILLFTTLSAAVTYQAGLNPPGGLWLDTLDGHKAGDPILLSKNPARYRVFIYCNSMALVASLVAIVMALTERCQRRRSSSLDGLMVLDLICLIGAYAAGCCRDVQTSIHVISLGGAVVVYVVFHMAFLMSRTKLHPLIENDKKVELDRDLMLGILGATLTYQTGLTPPGGFWPSDDQFGHHAGDPVLLSTYPSHYTVFFYLNAICFMASIFLTILFVNPFLYRAGIRSRALFICVLAVLFGLMGAYAAGSYRNLGPSIYIITWGAAVLIFIISILYLLYKLPDSTGSESSITSNPESGEQSEQQIIQERKEKVLMHLVVIGSIGATVTYQAGFAPPRSFWPDDSNGHAVGYPVLRDMDAHLYRIFFFCNTTSFTASSFIMNGGPMLQLLDWLFDDWVTKQQTVYTVLQAPTVVYAIGILGAYAAGSSSGWNNTSAYAMALVAPVLFRIFLIDPVVKLVLKAASTLVFE
ncbi:hypothetical protein EJB05_26786, partial [Eragrostis curvula]